MGDAHGHQEALGRVSVHHKGLSERQGSTSVGVTGRALLTALDEGLHPFSAMITVLRTMTYLRQRQDRHRAWREGIAIAERPAATIAQLAIDIGHVLQDPGVDVVV